jgi:hypothetical protein
MQILAPLLATTFFPYALGSTNRENAVFPRRFSLLFFRVLYFPRAVFLRDLNDLF